MASALYEHRVEVGSTSIAITHYIKVFVGLPVEKRHRAPPSHVHGDSMRRMKMKLDRSGGAQLGMSAPDHADQ
ncbi:MAG: hypothetical protein DRJ68_03030 [Thermoprotei archaeon]|nr:MAG: hypothetical protein DRJ68_03030 [Thermoprotei archaeon]